MNLWLTIYPGPEPLSDATRCHSFIGIHSQGHREIFAETQDASSVLSGKALTQVPYVTMESLEPIGPGDKEWSGTWFPEFPGELCGFQKSRSRSQGEIEPRE